MKVAVLGAGVMGRNIARVLLRAGAEVALCSRTEQTLADARRSLEQEAPERIAYVTSIAEAASGADLILESVPESLPLKLELLPEIERSAPPGAVIGTNTSSLPLELLGEALDRPGRFLGLHWFNPAHLVPLVEVIPTAATEPGVVSWSVTALSEMGKRPLVLTRPIDGFLANRLQYALIREALQLIEDGLATPEQIDAVLTDCLGPRWAVIGPMRSTDLAGVETAVAVAKQLFPTLSNAEAPQRALSALLEEGRLGVRAQRGFYSYSAGDGVAEERDRRLSAVLGALAAEADG
jgi:3-hydroxybutyryl-CoA dehydrogenase